MTKDTSCINIKNDAVFAKMVVIQKIWSSESPKFN